jgi:hypothetical protein
MTDRAVAIVVGLADGPAAAERPRTGAVPSPMTVRVPCVSTGADPKALSRLRARTDCAGIVLTAWEA